MKLLFLTLNYAEYLRGFYSRHTGLENAPYSQQRATLESDGFSRSGGWAGLQSLGYEYTEIVANARHLQKSWAHEHGITWSELSWKTAVPLAQIEAIQPEIVLTDAPRDFDVAWLSHLRERCPSIRLLLGWSQSPINEYEVLRHYDTVLSGSQFILNRYREKGCRTAFLRLGFNRDVLTRLPPVVDPDPVVTFSGGLVRGRGYHSERMRLLEAMVDSSTPLRLYSAQPGVTPLTDALTTGAKWTAYAATQLLRATGASQETRRRLPGIGKAATWTSAPPRQISTRLWPHMRPAVYGLEMFSILQRSAVTLNAHGEITGPDASNLRLFEATGVGSCLLTDFKPNLGELFEPDKEVVVYRSADECIEKSNWLLDRPRERCAIAAAGQARALRDHTIENRAVELDAIIGGLLAKPASMTR